MIKRLRDLFLIKTKFSTRLRMGFFLILVFMVVLAVFVGYQSTSRALTNTEIEHKKSLSLLGAMLVHERIDGIKTLGISLADRPLLVEKVSGGDWDGAINILQDISEKFSLVDRIFLADPQSIIRADFPHLGNALGRSRKQTDWYKGVSKTWQPYVSAVFVRDSLPKLKVVDIAIPIKSGNTTIGILVLQIQANNFVKITQNLGFDKEEILYILDQKGHIVYHPFFSSQTSIIDFSSIPVVGEALQGHGGVKEDYNFFKHKWKFAAFQRIDEFGWVVVVTQPSQIAFAQRDQILFRLAIFYGIFSVGGLLLVLLILYLWDAQQKVYDDLKTAQAQLIQSDRMASVGQLAAGVAHEINNPMGFIGSNIDVLENYIKVYTGMLKMVEGLRPCCEDGDINKVKGILEEIKLYQKSVNLEYIVKDMDGLFAHTREGIERIQTIIKDLKIFSHEDLGEVSSVQIEEVIDSVLNIVHNEIKYKADLKKNYGTTPLVHCSAHKMGQVFINLLINAVQAIEDKGVIEVRTYQQDHYVCVDVRDTGKGIPKENLKKIFDPFFSTKPVEQGTGLGLSISYEIVKKYGGAIKVQSQAGRGTTFTIMLPIK